MHAMGKFCADDVEQLTYYRSTGYFQDIPKVYADLGELVVGKKAGRENDEERIMSMNLGVAIEDIAVAARVYDAARRKGSGQTLPL
jgi:ornithine cyclodeaminase/alanine dehydrogenase-like protein (mu-crystallin family)